MQQPVRVIIKHTDTDKVERDTVGDYSSHTFRIWISKATMWALHNDHYVMIGLHND